MRVRRRDIFVRPERRDIAGSFDRRNVITAGAQADVNSIEPYPRITRTHTFVSLELLNFAFVCSWTSKILLKLRAGRRIQTITFPIRDK